MDSRNVAVLITGCSSGIGRALCNEFYKNGCRVIATARKIETIDDLKVRGMETHKLDVTVADDIDCVVDAIVKNGGSIDILINNAGYGLMGPSIEIPDSDFHLQMGTNVIAPLAVTRKVAPLMRNKGKGVVVNIGSISGLVPTPFSGAYCASKAALHALSDALRIELAPFNIRVVTVQAGAVQSNFGETASRQAADLLQPQSWYQSVQENVINRARLSQRDATSAEQFARKIVSLVLTDKPPAIIRVGKKSWWLPAMKKWFPRALLDGILSKKFGLNKIH